MARTHFSGPVQSYNGFIAGTAGAEVKAILSGTVSVTISALSAAAEEDVDVTITGLAAGDIVTLMPPEAAMEAGVMFNCWVGAANTLSIRITNASGSSLTGSTTSWTYLLHDLT
jgi:hypothetical protein